MKYNYNYFYPEAQQEFCYWVWGDWK